MASGRPPWREAVDVDWALHVASMEASYKLLLRIGLARYLRCCSLKTSSVAVFTGAANRTAAVLAGLWVAAGLYLNRLPSPMISAC